MNKEIRQMLVYQLNPVSDNIFKRKGYIWETHAKIYDIMWNRQAKIEEVVVILSSINFKNFKYNYGYIIKNKLNIVFYFNI